MGLAPVVISLFFDHTFRLPAGPSFFRPKTKQKAFRKIHGPTASRSFPQDYRSPATRLLPSSARHFPAIPPRRTALRLPLVGFSVRPAKLKLFTRAVASRPAPTAQVKLPARKHMPHTYCARCTTFNIALLRRNGIPNPQLGSLKAISSFEIW